MALVTLRGVRKSYRQGEVEVPALRGIDLSLDPGEFTALVGPSGSGKTTLLNMIGALDSTSAGEILLEEHDLGRMSEVDRAHYRLFHVGFIFQAYNLIPVLSARENIEFVMVLQGRPAAECRARALRYLERVGMAALADRRPSALSGGQQQRVAVARALAAGPRLVLADEPTANLDTATAVGLLQLMRDLNQEERVTFLFSTHDPRVMERARRIVTLEDGTITRIQDRDGQPESA